MTSIARKSYFSKKNNNQMRLICPNQHNQNDFTDTGKSSKMAGIWSNKIIMDQTYHATRPEPIETASKWRLRT